MNSGPIPARGFRVVLADPAWQFDAYSKAGLKKSPERHYETMPLRDIIALRGSLEFGRILESDCVLFLWASSTYLAMAMECMRGWGFEYKSYCGWRKLSPNSTVEMDEDGEALEQMGTGYYFRSTLELLLVGTRNHPGLPRTKYRNLISEPVREHSRKPDKTYEIIERGYPGGPYLELFARRRRPGWTSWGKGLEPVAPSNP